MSKILTSGFKPRKSLLAITIASTLAFAPTAVFAAEEVAETEEVERISVTGSRIKRISMEAASPVVTIDAAMMEQTGFSTVADVLRNSSLNSFGSFGGGSNNGWSAQANIALKGVGAEKTLVLIDGVRLSKSPITGGSANLNMIPTAAVERMDILTDGASAIYGSDAVAGVINIILKKDFTGLEVSAKFERPDEVKGADSEKYTFTGGISSDKGTMVFSWEHYEEEQLLLSDLSYATAQLKEPGLDPAYIDNWHGISGTGRVIEESRDGWADKAFNTQNNCDVYNTGAGGLVGPLKRYGNDSVVCGYDYTTVAQEMPDTRRDSIMTNMTYELTDDTTLTARGMWMSQTTEDNSAGDPAWFQAPSGLPERNITTAAGDNLDLTQVDKGGWIGYRMNNLGQRKAEHNDNSLDLLIGLEGSLGEMSWDISANYARYDAFTWGTNYTSVPVLENAIYKQDPITEEWSGWDPRDPDAGLPDGISANFDKRRSTSQTSVRGGLQFDVIELPAGEVGAYVGASHSRETYYSKIDGQAEVGNTGGGNGGSGGIGERTIDAAFFEMVVPVLDNLELNLAGRYDDYSDFGGTFNPMASISYRPIESLLLRASAGTGFQAPLLTDLYSAGSRGYQTGETNYIGCYLAGTEPSECNMTDDYWGTAGGNPELEAEESESTNLGLVWQFTDNFSTTFDYWTLKTEKLVDVIDYDVIQLMQIQLWKAEGIDSDIANKLPGVDIIYKGGAVSSNMDEIISPKTNVGLQEVGGFDWTIKGIVETEFGDFNLSVNWSHMTEYKTSFIDADGNNVLGQDELGDVYAPQDRVNTTVAWSMEDHSVSLYSSFTSEQEDSYLDDEGVKQVTDSLDSFLTHNLTYTYHAPWNGKVSLAVLNVLDEEPPRRLKDPRSPVGQLYDIRERVFTMSYTQTF